MEPHFECIPDYFDYERNFIDENKGAHKRNWCRFQPPSENMQVYGNKAK